MSTGDTVWAPDRATSSCALMPLAANALRSCSAVSVSAGMRPLGSAASASRLPAPQSEAKLHWKDHHWRFALHARVYDDVLIDIT